MQKKRSSLSLYQRWNWKNFISWRKRNFRWSKSNWTRSYNQLRGEAEIDAKHQLDKELAEISSKASIELQLN